MAIATYMHSCYCDYRYRDADYYEYYYYCRIVPYGLLYMSCYIAQPIVLRETLVMARYSKC